MSRRKRGGESSLELLLDTICNTFGGILFVAILIVVMLRLTSKTKADSETPLPTEVEQLELERQYEELKGTLDALSKAMAAASEMNQVVDPNTSQLLAEYRTRQQIRHELMAERLETLESVAELTQATDKGNRDYQENTEKKQDLERQQEDLQSELKEAVAKRTQKVDYSQLRPSDKQEVGIVLRYGRLYVWHRYGRGGTREGLNTDEFVVLEDTDGQVRSTPNPAAGTAIDETDQSAREVTARLSAFDPSYKVFAVIIWPDSFDQFRQVKEAMLQLGFNYRLMPMELGEKVYDRGGQSSGVQ